MSKTFPFLVHMEEKNLSFNKVKVKVILRPTVSRPDRDQFFFLSEIFLLQLRVCYFVAPSLMRGQVCNLLLLLGLGTQDHILLSQ
jgi:hypothetical protein